MLSTMGLLHCNPNTLMERKYTTTFQRQRNKQKSEFRRQIGIEYYENQPDKMMVTVFCYTRRETISEKYYKYT